MSCKVINTIGSARRHLGLRLFWDGHRSFETTRLDDTPENRDFLEAQAKIISREIKLGTFDYLKHFPAGNKAHLYRSEEPRQAVTLQTVRAYYEKWIERRTNQVRPQQVQCEKSYFKIHILPAEVAGQEFGDIYLTALAVDHLQELQDFFKAQRIGEKPYKAASINKFIGALQAMIKDARRTRAITVNPFDPVLFSRLEENDSQTVIDPYLPEEREKILAGFLTHSRSYYAFVFHQFWTGCRPSEACALQRGDVDLNYGWERIEKSLVAGNQGGTKTKSANRQIRLHDNLIDVLKAHVRFMLEPGAHLFTTPAGVPIDESNFYKREWLPMLRKLKIRPRPFYNTRHSYVSFLLSIGGKDSMNFISAQTGDREGTLKKHYARYIDRIDPQRDWIENQIRQSEKREKKVKNPVSSDTFDAESDTPKTQKPLVSQGLKSGAGDRGRTDDLMLGKHTL